MYGCTYRSLCVVWCTVEPFYGGHHWGLAGYVLYREVPLKIKLGMQLCVAWTASSGLNREVTFILGAL